MKRSELLFSSLLVPVDFLMLVSAGMTAYVLRTRILSAFRPVYFDVNLPLARYVILVVTFASIFMVMYAISGLYRLRTTRSTLEEFSRVAIASSAGIMAIIIYIFLQQQLFDSRFLVLASWILAIFFVTFGRVAMRYLQRFLVWRYDLGVHRVAVIGDDMVSNNLANAIEQNPILGYRIVGRLIDPVLDDVHAIVAGHGLDEIILANPNYPAERVLELIDFCNEQHLTFSFIPNMYQTLTANFAFDTLAGVPMIELRRTALGGWGQVMKRAIDIAGALFGLIVLFPVFALIAFLIKWTSDGPVLVSLKRVSRGKLFKLYKFRSMIKNAEALKQYLVDSNERTDGPLFKMKHDPRVTSFGRILRKYRLDELPQLYNVLIGQMSLVGPRPHQPDEIARYAKHHKRVLAIKAGVTGMAQVSGSSDLPFEEEVTLDTFYIEHWSLWQDIKILILTILKLVRDRSAV